MREAHGREVERLKADHLRALSAAGDRRDAALAKAERATVLAEQRCAAFQERTAREADERVAAQTSAGLTKAREELKRRGQAEVEVAMERLGTEFAALSARKEEEAAAAAAARESVEKRLLQALGASEQLMKQVRELHSKLAAAADRGAAEREARAADAEAATGRERALRRRLAEEQDRREREREEHERQVASLRQRKATQLDEVSQRVRATVQKKLAVIERLGRELRAAESERDAAAGMLLRIDAGLTGAVASGGGEQRRGGVEEEQEQVEGEEREEEEEEREEQELGKEQQEEELEQRSDKSYNDESQGTKQNDDRKVPPRTAAVPVATAAAADSENHRPRKARLASMLTKSVLEATAASAAPRPQVHGRLAI